MARHADSRGIPPYLPYRTFVTYLDSLRAFMPQVIDRSSMRSFSGAIQSWLINGLKYLHMIDENGVPRPRLAQLANATAEDRRPMLRQLIEAEYGFLRGVDLQRTTPKVLDDAFESTGAKGDTVRKCVAFFLALAKDAQVPLSPLLLKSHRRSPSPRSNGRRSAAPTVVNPTNQELSTQELTIRKPSEILLEILDPEEMGEEEQAAVWTLLKYLRKQSR